MSSIKIKNSSGEWESIPALKGDKGDTPNITVKATTLEPGSQATVVKSGTAEAPIFTFGIPKGMPGNPADIITVGTEDLTEGASLPTGTIYLVYE